MDVVFQMGMLQLEYESDTSYGAHPILPLPLPP